MGKVLIIGQVRGSQPPVSVPAQKHVHILEKWEQEKYEEWYRPRQCGEDLFF